MGNLSDIFPGGFDESWVIESSSSKPFRSASQEHARALSALQHLSPNVPRDKWVKIGMAAETAGLTWDEWNDWSSSGDSYKQSDAHTAWKSFQPDGGTGAGTLFYLARNEGWVDEPTTIARSRPEKSPAKPLEPPKKPLPGMGAAEVWGRCEPATAEHGYIVAKGGHPGGLRVVPTCDSLRVAGQSMAGALVVPVVPLAGGEPVSLQFVGTPAQSASWKAAGVAKKLNLPGAPMDGVFVVGAMVYGGTTYVCEGIGQAWACWQATDSAAVVCFGAGNMGKVARALRQLDSGARLVLVPDVGKESDAAKIAAAVSGVVALMPEGWRMNADVNDFAKRNGIDTLKLLLTGASEPPRPPPLLKSVSVFDVLTHPSPPPAFVWDSYLPRGVVTLLSAHGGTGKSYIALMLAVCVALGRPLFGVETSASKTLFVSLEDGAPLVRRRLADICGRWGINPLALGDRLRIVDGTENPELFSAETRGAGETTATYAELHTLVQSDGIGLVVVDNASDAYGGDEIQRRQVRAFMRSLTNVARLTDCGVLLLAHVDKATSREKKAAGGEGYSGSTAWHNSARSRLFLVRGDDGLLKLEHQKGNLGGEMRQPITLQWSMNGLPQLLESGPDTDELMKGQQCEADNGKAIALLKLIAECESRNEFMSPNRTARNNVHSQLRIEPSFARLKLSKDDTARIVNHCQRGGWLAHLEYRNSSRRPSDRWTVTAEGREVAGLPAAVAPETEVTELVESVAVVAEAPAVTEPMLEASATFEPSAGLAAPTALTAPTSEESAQSAQDARGALTAPTCVGGVGECAHTQLPG